MSYSLIVVLSILIFIGVTLASYFVLKRRGRRDCALATLAIWLLVLGLYFSFREPALPIFPEDTTQLRDYTFAISSALGIVVSTAAFWVAPKKLSSTGLLWIAIPLAIVVGFLFPIIEFSIYCGVFGRCDP